jgi:hypothetical protein
VVVAEGMMRVIPSVGKGESRFRTALLTGKPFVCVRVRVLRHWVYAAIVEVPYLPLLK